MLNKVLNYIRKNFSYPAPFLSYNYNYGFFFYLPYNTNITLLVFIILSVILVYCVYKKSSSVINISLTIIIALTTTSFLFPTFSFFFMVLVSSVILILMFPYKLYEGFFEKRKSLIKDFLNILEKTEVLDFLSVVYIKFFCVPTRLFKLRLAIILFFSLIYILTSRYYFYQSIIMHSSFSTISYFFIYLALFLGIMTSYSRLIINLSLIFVPLTLRTDSTLLSPTVLYILDPEDNTSESPKESPKDINSNSKRRFSFINIERTRNYYRQTFTNAAHGNYYRNLGVCIGVCGVAAASFAAYYSKVQADYARVQAEQAKQQTYHTAREADVAAVEASLITKEEYYRRHPQDRPK